MRHIVNFGLLASFLTLAVTGALAFSRPFSLVTTRVHLVFGLATLVLVGLHLASRVSYFKRQLAPKAPQRPPVPRPLLLGIAAGWALLLVAALVDWAPVTALVRQSYEAKRHREIVRVSSLSGFIESSAKHRLVARKPNEEADVALSLSIGLNPALPLEPSPPAMAVWAESTTGAMIETLYLDPAVAYSDQPVWGGEKTPRVHILPLWRHRYTMVSGIDPSGEVDALSGATSSHSFSLDHYLKLGEEKSFVLCVEINAPKDPNETFPDPQVGQPSLLYTALIELDSDQSYVLLELTGHGGGSEKSGAIHYDLEGFTTAKQWIDLLLAKAAPIANDA